MARRRGGIKKVRKVMREFKSGTLKSSAGATVRKRKQAVAIALSEGRQAGAKIPKKKSPKKKAAREALTRRTEESQGMLRSVKEMLSYSILATDGEIGTVDDVLVGESDLKLRYLVIDTGGWLSGRQVLLSTAWLSSVEPGKETVVVNIEKKRIKASPPYESGTAIDREYEARLHDYYGHPYYWV